MRSTVCAVLLAVSFLMPGNVDARDWNTDYASYDISCGAWLDRPEIDPLKVGWVTGYMTATNMAVVGKHDFFKSTDIKSIILFVNKFCRENPLKNSGGGMIDLTVELKIPVLK